MRFNMTGCLKRAGQFSWVKVHASLHIKMIWTLLNIITYNVVRFLPQSTQWFIYMQIIYALKSALHPRTLQYINIINNVSIGAVLIYRITSFFHFLTIQKLSPSIANTSNPPASKKQEPADGHRRIRRSGVKDADTARSHPAITRSRRLKAAQEVLQSKGWHRYA